MCVYIYVCNCLKGEQPQSASVYRRDFLARKPRAGEANIKASGCAALWPHQRPQCHSKTVCTSPLHQSQQSCSIHARGPAFQGTQSATKLKDTSRRVGRALALNFSSFRARSSDRGRPKASKKRSREGSMPTFCLTSQFYSGGAERAERHD